MNRLLIAATLCALLPGGTAWAACATYPYNLTNGTAADATQVMANFNCAALTSGTTLENVVKLGIGMVPSYALDITQNQNAASAISILNNSSGTSAQSRVIISNGTHSVSMGQFGQSFATTGAFQAGRSYISSDGPLVLQTGTGGTPQPIIFSPNATPTEVGRWATDGSLLVNTTTSGGISGLAKLAVEGVNGNAVAINDADTGTSYSLWIRKASTLGQLVRFQYTTTDVGSITTNGTTTAYNTTSDERLKDWSIPQRNYEQIIKNLWVGDFRWKKTGENSFGYRAQQAFGLFPIAVNRPQQDGQWQMDYSKTAPLALWGVKDLYRRLDRQTETVAATRHQVQALTREVSYLRDQNSQALAQIARLQLKMEEMRTKVGERWAKN